MSNWLSAFRAHRKRVREAKAWVEAEMPRVKAWFEEEYGVSPVDVKVVVRRFNGPGGGKYVVSTNTIHVYRVTRLVLAHEYAHAVQYARGDAAAQPRRQIEGVATHIGWRYADEHGGATWVPRNGGMWSDHHHGFWIARRYAALFGEYAAVQDSLYLEGASA